jgi:hypothetical protein
MNRDECAACGGEIVQLEVVPVERLAGPEYGSVEGTAVAGSLADVCSRCDRFAGQACDKCRGRVLWEWRGPGQALGLRGLRRCRLSTTCATEASYLEMLPVPWRVLQLDVTGRPCDLHELWV